ncbi:hypothetical protein H0A36_07760 [Endozoicomonas sp. SM1973]|uniref:Uncharacterized protein n=1 Tax=Spartinivicinus marinus TaxID=2994442 RepID=A0A853I5E0_9GAMM|nr:hypothetical protein [Spartinivicinus marinus]MCX4029183.1 hypothetical protein [Spartinivicinus marinus]NYZ65908.1 hypothetical protein [Spartinivicinus marinus]
MKKLLIILSLVIVVVGGPLFLKWLEKELAEPYREEISPNGKFKIVLYDVAEYTVYAKLYSNESGKLLGESPVVESFFSF